MIKTYSIANFSQVSNWTVTEYPQYNLYYNPAPSTDTDYKTIDLSDIPAGSVINSAYIEATFGSPNTGIAMAHTAFKLGDGAYTTSSAWDDTVNPRTEPIPVTRLAPGAITTIQFQFRANGSLENPGSFSGSLAYADITVYVDYTLPYTACTPPTSIAFSKNNAAPGEVVNMTWSGQAGGTNNPITGYRVYRSTTAGGTYTLLSSPATASLNVSAPDTNGGTYYYKIVAVGTVSGYDSDYSAASGALTTTVTACAAPSAISFSSNNVAPGASVTMTWSGHAAGTNNAITKFEVYRATSSGGTYSLLSSPTSASLSVSARTGNGENAADYKNTGTLSGC